MISERLRAKAWAIEVARTHVPITARVLPLTLRSKANEATTTMRGRRGQVARTKTQRSAARMALSGWSPGTIDRLVVLLTRISPRELDDDNLAGALKSGRDGVADALRVNDRDPRIVWLVDWEQGKKHEVRIEVFRED
jgi:hypothetical protein